MTVFTEDFIRSDVSGLDGQTVDLGVNNWFLTWNGSGVFSNSFSQTTTPSNPSGAALATLAGDHVQTITTAAVSAGVSTNQTGSFFLSFGSNDEYGSINYWQLQVRGDFNDGLWRYSVSVALTNGNLFTLNDFNTSFMTGSIVNVGDTLTFQVTGQDTATVAVVKQNGVTLGTYGQAAMLAAGMVAGDFALLPDGTFDVIGTSGNVANDNRIDAYTDTATAWPPGPINYRLPAMSSDVPYLQGNDRYQTVLCVNRGTATTPPEFRYWFAGPPSWDESV